MFECVEKLRAQIHALVLVIVADRLAHGGSFVRIRAIDLAAAYAVERLSHNPQLQVLVRRADGAELEVDAADHAFHRLGTASVRIRVGDAVSADDLRANVSTAVPA
jgi:hypothetical protein